MAVLQKRRPGDEGKVAIREAMDDAAVHQRESVTDCCGEIDSSEQPEVPRV